MLGKVPRMALRIDQKVKVVRTVVVTMMAHQAWTLMVSSNLTGIKQVLRVLMYTLPSCLKIIVSLLQIVDNFDEMKLKEKLLRGIYAYGFERPSAIQQRAILPCIMGHDVIAQAQSGTGKTATFAISLLQQIDIELNECQALVLAPTRELAQQIQKVEN